MHVTFCECLVFYEFRRNLYITVAKYLEQEGIADLLFLVYLYTVFSSIEVISWDESSIRTGARYVWYFRHVFHCSLFSLFIWYSSRDHNETVPNKTQSQYH